MASIPSSTLGPLSSLKTAQLQLPHLQNGDRGTFHIGSILPRMRSQPPTLAGPIPLIWFPDFSFPPLSGTVLKGQCWQTWLCYSLKLRYRGGWFLQWHSMDSPGYINWWSSLTQPSRLSWMCLSNCLVASPFPSGENLHHSCHCQPGEPGSQEQLSPLFSRHLGWSNTFELEKQL